MKKRKSEMNIMTADDTDEPTYYINNITATIPKTATKIDHSNYFMCMCKSLQRVTFESPSSLSKIGLHAFYKCSSLTYIDLPPSVSTIGMDAFSHCSALGKIDFPSSLVRIAPRAFHKCISLQSVCFPPSLVYLDKFAFFDCISLVVVTFSQYQLENQYQYQYQLENQPRSQKSKVVIGKDAFYGCTSLVSIVLPSSSSIVEASLFQDCDILQLATNNIANTNDNSSKTLLEWVKNRFKHLPLHYFCYSAKWPTHPNGSSGNSNNNNTSASACSALRLRHYLQHQYQSQNQCSISKIIHAVDGLGMNALHVLVCNPQVTADQIKVLLEVEAEAEVNAKIENQIEIEMEGVFNPTGCDFNLQPLVSMKMVNEMTPVDLFLACRCRNVSSRRSIANTCHYKNDENRGRTRQQNWGSCYCSSPGRLHHCLCRPTLCTGGEELNRGFSLFDAIDQGMTWNEIECLLILDRRFVKDQYLEYSIKIEDGESLSSSSKLKSSSSKSFGLNPLLHASINDSCSLDVLYNLAKYNVTLLLHLCKE